jgi:hypothetical protein
MSQMAPASTASSRFRAIFTAALKSYEKQTKTDLVAHPLASQLQLCDSTSAILALLQDQVREFDQTRSGDERLTKWLTPTVNVLLAFSATVSGGVSLVCLDNRVSLSPDSSSDIYGVGIFARECDICRHWGIPFRKCPIYDFERIVLTSGLIGGQGCCDEYRCSRRALPTYRILL